MILKKEHFRLLLSSVMTLGLIYFFSIIYQIHLDNPNTNPDELINIIFRDDRFEPFLIIAGATFVGLIIAANKKPKQK